jgi:hypothetical protein
MKTRILFFSISLSSTILAAQDTTFQEKWHNGSLKTHLILSKETALKKSQDTLYLEQGYENWFSALKRWRNDSLFMFDFEGRLLNKYFGNIHSINSKIIRVLMLF